MKMPRNDANQNPSTKPTGTAGGGANGYGELNWEGDDLESRNRSATSSTRAAGSTRPTSPSKSPAKPLPKAKSRTAR
jgi:hypothetical protein